MTLTRRRLLATVAAFTAASTALGTPLLAQQRGGRLVIVTAASPRTLNPATQSGTGTGVPGAQIFASPLKFDAEWNPQPYLAKSWVVADDGLSVSLTLVDNAVFHDGAPVTSADVAFSIELLRDNHPFNSMFSPVTHVETPDAHTAVIHLSAPHPAILLALSGVLCPILPKHVYGDGQDIKTHPANTAPVGCGPFKFVSFKPGEEIVLERFDDFFIDGHPYLDGMVIRTVKDASAILIAMENGDADMFPFMSGSQQVKRLEKQDGIEVTSQGYAAVGPIVWLAFNTARAPLDDVKVRQAIAYATDRDFITKALHRGTSQPQRGPIVEQSPFFEPDIEAYDLDLDRANALMDEAGLAPDSSGKRLSLTIDYVPALPAEQGKNVAEYLKSQLKKIGIELEVRAAPDFPTWSGRVGNHDFDLTIDILFNWGDPVIGVHRSYLSDNIKPGVIWSNTQSYANARVDELLAQATVEMDPVKRKLAYSEFQKIVAQDLPVYWLNTMPFHTAYKASIVNPPLSIWGPMQSMDDLSLS